MDKLYFGLMAPAQRPPRREQSEIYRENLPQAGSSAPGSRLMKWSFARKGVATRPTSGVGHTKPEQTARSAQDGG